MGMRETITATDPGGVVPQRSSLVVGWGMERERARDADVAFGEFVAGASPDLVRLAWVLVLDRDEARDLTREALARTYVHWARIWASGEDPFPYVRRTLVNLRTDRWRRRARRDRAERLWTALPQGGGISEDGHGVVEDSDSLMRLLCELTVRQRQVIALRYLQDLSVRDTAAALGLSAAAVKMATSRALERLRSVVEEDGR